MKRPTVDLAVAFNDAVREHDEWFDEPDDVERLGAALAAIASEKDPVVAAAVLAARVTLTQPFTEGNKRTAMILARWMLDENGMDGARFLPADDRVVADVLVKAASGHDVETEMVEVLNSRR